MFRIKALRHQWPLSRLTKSSPKLLSSSAVRIKREAAQESLRIIETIWWPLNDDRRVVPVDPIRIASALGIDVYYSSQLDSSTSGALIKERGQDPVILLNSVDSPNRKRFTCAHEIGHYVRRSADVNEFHYIDKRDETASTGTKEEEIFANEFGASLLMPEVQVRFLHKQGLNEIEMQYKFDVSREAMNFRLKNLGLGG